MKKNPLNWMFLVAVFGVILTAIAAYAGTPFRSVKAFTVSCGTSATLIDNGDGGYSSVRCGNASATEIYVGGSAVTTAAGYPVCTGSNCVDAGLTLDASQVGYCIVAAGTQTLKCIAGK